MPRTGDVEARATPDVAIQLYTLRRMAAQDLEATLRAVAELGYAAVEPYDAVAGVERHAALLAELGLAAPSMHAPLLDGPPEAAFAAARRLGAGTVVVPWVDPERWTDRAAIEELARDLSRVAEPAADLGLRVGYHNHWFEPRALGGATALERFADALAPGVVLEVDVFWVAAAGADPVALLERLGERARLLHVKDGTGVRDRAPVTAERVGDLMGDQVAVGGGEVPIAEALAAARHAELAVVELDEHRGDLLAAVGESLRFLTAARPA
jgi:sugar phosphate isomerase/epimerase